MLAQLVDLHLAVLPGKNFLLFNALACAILDEGLQDTPFIAERASGFAEFAAFIQAYRPEIVASECGVPAAQIRACARLYAQGQPSMQVHGLGMTEHTQGSEGVMSLINLALITGNLGKAGSGVNPLRGQNNVQGAAHSYEPKSLTGGQTLAQARQQFEQIWGVPLPTSDGLSLPKMMAAAETNAQLQASDYLDICAEDAARLGIVNGQTVKLVSRYGEIELPARISENVFPGLLYTTFHLPALFVNRLTSPYQDGITGAPEYKVTAVRVA